MRYLLALALAALPFCLSAQDLALSMRPAGGTPTWIDYWLDWTPPADSTATIWAIEQSDSPSLTQWVVRPPCEAAPCTVSAILSGPPGPVTVRVIESDWQFDATGAANVVTWGREGTIALTLAQEPAQPSLAFYRLDDPSLYPLGQVFVTNVAPCPGTSVYPVFIAHDPALSPQQYSWTGGTTHYDDDRPCRITLPPDQPEMFGWILRDASDPLLEPAAYGIYYATRPVWPPPPIPPIQVPPGAGESIVLHVQTNPGVGPAFVDTTADLVFNCEPLVNDRLPCRLNLTFPVVFENPFVWWVATEPYVFSHLIPITATLQRPPIEGPIPECQRPLGNRAVAVFVTRLDRTGSGGPGSRARLDFQLASPNSPIVEARVELLGQVVARAQGATVGELAGLWFDTPSEPGNYPVAVFARNAYGCTAWQPTVYTIAVAP